MTRHIRHAGFFCVLLLVALLGGALRIQLLDTRPYDANPGNRRATIARYEQPRATSWSAARA